MKRRFFIRRFLRYLMLLMVPTILIFSFAMISFNYQLDRSLDARAKNTLSSVNNSLEMMVSNVAYQNEQLTNNAYTLIALKRLMQRETRIPYSDAIHNRRLFLSPVSTLPLSLLGLLVFGLSVSGWV